MKTSSVQFFLFYDRTQLNILKLAHFKQQLQYHMKKKNTKKNQIKVQENSYSSDEQDVSNNKKGRQDNSLSVLTKKFVELIKNSPDATIDLNEAVKKLDVQKRRIYDITNVLQGIGYVEKLYKNTIKWIGGSQDPEIQRQIKDMKKKIESMQDEQRMLDEQINEFNRKIRMDYLENEALREYLFITYDDCLKISQAMKSQSQQSFLLLSAPKGSTLETSQTENQYELILNAGANGKIRAYSIQQSKGLRQIMPRTNVKKQI